MFYVYLDESWDLGFDFENKSPSRYFTLTLVVVKSVKDNKQIKKEIEIVLKRKLNKKKSKRIKEELKWSKTDLSIKKYFYKRIKILDFDIYSITFDKIKVNYNLQKNKARLYNYFVKLLVDKVDLSWVKHSITIVLDKSKNKAEIKDCNDYLIRHIETKVDLSVTINIEHKDSIEIKQLQTADMFCYWFFEKYNKNNNEWFDIFKEKVKFDELYFK